MKKKSLLNIVIATFLIGFAFIEQAKAQNLLDLQGWSVGQGSSGVFNQNGQTSENAREWGIGPHGQPVILWKSKPEGNANDDGGWNSSYFSINYASMYRFTIWLKKTNSTDGYSYFGCANVLNLDGTDNGNPYFWYGDLPELNKWYLVAGYVHGSGDTSTTNYGGIYDGVNGNKVADITDFKFAVGAGTTNHRTYLYYDPNVNDQQFFYAPRVEVVNGDEPPIPALLGLQGVSTGLAYFPGKVGIKTPNPGDYDLAVNGKIRAQEIKVEAANWPDYVFAEDYKYRSLAEVDQFIKTNKHLPDMPSTQEVEKAGLDLGEMNKKLLKQVEELYLHLIDKDKQSNKQQEQINILNKEYLELKKALLKQNGKKK
jgi:hypothetical protein